MKTKMEIKIEQEETEGNPRLRMLPFSRPAVMVLMVSPINGPPWHLLKDDGMNRFDDKDALPFPYYCRKIKHQCLEELPPPKVAGGLDCSKDAYGNNQY